MNNDEKPTCDEPCCKPAEPCCEPVTVENLMEWATKAKCFLVKYGYVLPGVTLVVAGFFTGFQWSLVGFGLLAVMHKLKMIEKKIECAGPWY